MLCAEKFYRREIKKRKLPERTKQISEEPVKFYIYISDSNRKFHRLFLLFFWSEGGFYCNSDWSTDSLLKMTVKEYYYILDIIECHKVEPDQ